MKNEPHLKIVLKFVFVLTAALVTVLYSLESQAESEGPYSQLQVKKPTFEFGSVPQGHVVEHEFVIANVGKGLLKIRKIHPACGCTAAVIESDEIKPGEETAIRVRFDTTGFQGEKTKTVRIYTNDPEHTSSTLSLKGTVLAPIAISPFPVSFQQVKKGKEHKVEVELKVSSWVKAKIIDVQSRSEYVDVKSEDVSPKGQEGSQFKLSVVLKDNAPMGNLDSRIVIKTNNKEFPVVNLPVISFIEGDMELRPRAVSFGLINAPLNEPLEENGDSKK